MIIDVSKECNNKQIVIGRRGENNATIIQFEFSAWKREFGDGSLGLAARLPRNVEPYIVTLETEGTVSTWTVSSYDTQNNGQGAIQVVYIVDGVVKKSQVYRTYILDSIEGSVPTPPDPYESYIEQMMEIAADTYMNAQSAADSATNAAGSAGDAAGSARDASGYADNAAGSARDASGYANAASGSATAAETDALKAEGFAVGEQGGEAVGSGSPYYHNNAEYYSDQAGSSATSASGSATSAETNALKAEGYAVGKQNGTDVGDTSPYYHNNAEYYATEAAASAQAAAQSASVFVIDPTLTHSGQAADAKVTGDELASVKSDLSEKASVIISSASGSIAHFEDGSESDAVDVVAHINPLQDLHGYDSPWPAGGGKNIFNWDRTIGTPNPETLIDSPRTLSTDKFYVGLRPDNYYYPGYIQNYSVSNGVIKVTTLNNVNYGIAFPVKCDPSTQYAISCNLTKMQVGIGCYDAEWNFVSIISGMRTELPLNFTTPSNAAYISIVFGSVPLGEEGTASNVQIEKGTATSYSPYSNICPITGFTGVDIDVSGVNVWDEETELFNDVLGSKNYISVIPGGVYYWSAPSQPANGFYFYDINKNLISTVYSFSTAYNIITIPSNCYYVKFRMGKTSYGQTYNHDISINYPSTDHDYHPYNGDVYPITFPSEAGTVYGGYVDVTNGKLVVDRASVDLGSLTWTYQADYLGNPVFTSNKIDAFNNWQTRKGLCSRYEYSPIKVVNQAFYDNTICLVGDGRAFVRDSAFSDATAFKTAMSGVQLVYELATPITYDLTPQQIALLLGVNNVWHDANGDTDVEYKADTKLYIEQLTKPTEDDMTANTTIQSGKFFMVGNRLFLSTATIASGDTINPGTNCTELSLADALNSL